MNSENHHVTPTYQSLLILGMDTVARRLADGDVFGGWQALKTLYVELPKECQSDCYRDLASIETDLRNIVEAIQGQDLYQKRFLRLRAIQRYLSKSNLTLFDKFKNSLCARGYLENVSVKPRNLSPTPIGE
jgi:hypothetical protein